VDVCVIFEREKYRTQRTVGIATSQFDDQKWYSETVLTYGL